MYPHTSPADRPAPETPQSLIVFAGTATSKKYERPDARYPADVSVNDVPIIFPTATVSVSGSKLFNAVINH